MTEPTSPGLARDAPWRVTPPMGSEAVSRVLWHAPNPFAVTRGPTHTLTYTNAAFRRLAGESGLGRPMSEVLHPEPRQRLGTLLDRAYETATSFDRRLLGQIEGSRVYWSCAIWPILGLDGNAEGLGMELYRDSHQQRSAALQREVAERLLISALREAEAADSAEAGRVMSALLADAGRRLGASLDEDTTRGNISANVPSVLGAWCIVDVIEPDGTVSRLAMVHPDPVKQRLLHELSALWGPLPNDPFGAPAVLRAAGPVAITERVDEALGMASHTPENLQILREVGIGPLLSVPLMHEGRLLGAITFVRAGGAGGFAPEEVEFAEGFAAHSAYALDSARKYSEALLLRERAETVVQERMSFLGNIGHELRTPMQALIGYVDLIDLGAHGPVTDAQREDLRCIRTNQRHLLSLIDDILDFIRTGSARSHQFVDASLSSALADAFTIVEPLMAAKQLRYRSEPSDPHMTAYADPDSVKQILVNLLANAVKFTPDGGEIATGWNATADTVRISVSDTGIGVPQDKLETIFEPFVQLEPRAKVASGAGLGLAISRDLARAMNGDLTVESVLGRGSRFTLVLPRARGEEL